MASRLIEKLKIGKRFVLLDVEVAPDRAGEQIWDSTGPENKNVPLDVWRVIYRKLGELCKKQFGEGTGLRRESQRAVLDQEYLYRLEEFPNFVVRYEFKDGNYRDNLNIIFKEDGKRLHPGCLLVRIKNESREVFRMLSEQSKEIEKLQKENAALLALSVSQEYTPTPVKTASSSSTLEYVPTALNGTSPENHGRYKPSRIEDTVKCEHDPYTPSSSQEDSSSVAYVPAAMKTPRKKKESPVQQKPTVVSSSSECPKPKLSKRRRQEAEIFGNSGDDDDEEEESDLPPLFTSATKRHSQEVKSNGNMSDENLFSEESPAKEPIGSSSDDVPTNGRTMRDRKTKNFIDYNLVITSPEPKAESSSQSSKTAGGGGGGGSKRRRKESTKAKMNESLDGWLKKDTKKPAKKDTGDGGGGESSKSGKDKPAKEKKAAKKEAPVVRQPVDHEKLNKENEAMRRQIATLDRIDQMLPEDKTLLDVPYLTTGQLTTEEMIATYDTYKQELIDLHETYRDKTERQWQGEENLCYFTDMTLALTEDQKWEMIKKLERELVPREESGKYTEFFTSVLIMEWGLRVWMKLHGFSDRRQALDRIKLQEEANPMETTQT